MSVDGETLLSGHPHRRMNPLNGRWVLVSPNRTNRPWQGATQQPAVGYGPAHDAGCYLCAGNERAGGHVNPAYTGPMVFDNDFPALNDSTPSLSSRDALYNATTVQGKCRVVCYSEHHSNGLSLLQVPQIAAVVDVWASQDRELSKDFDWVQIFENRGEMMGCSSPHPHGQIWACDFVPSELADEDQTQQRYFDAHGRSMLLDVAMRETEAGSRVVLMSDFWLVIVPYWAGWPYETLLLPRFPVARMQTLTTAQKADLAQVIKQLTVKYDNLFQCPFPYSMGWHGAPMSSTSPEAWQLHAHFYPPLLRSATVKKFMVGFELLCESQRDVTPEFAAQRLRGLPGRHYTEAVRSSLLERP